MCVCVCVRVCVCARVPGLVNLTTTLPDLSSEMSYVVTDLRPFTAYAFRVSASTVVGEGPTAQVEEKTSEQGGCSRSRAGWAHHP